VVLELELLELLLVEQMAFQVVAVGLTMFQLELLLLAMVDQV